MDRLKSLQKAGNSAPMEEYKSLTSDTSRRGFALRLRVDPDASWCKVTESTGIANSNESSSLSGWMALWEIAKTEGIPYDTTNPDIMDTLTGITDGLPCKPHPKKMLAAKGCKVTHRETSLSAITFMASGLDVGCCLLLCFGLLVLSWSPSALSPLMVG
eukprot:3659870-Alexandrium_andersonii.AAC.1